jgi:Caspase domain
MSGEGQTPANASFHALLIGVDDYPVQALSGCVNDIDAVQRLLLESVPGITTDSIRRLVSPRAGTRHDTTVNEDPADFAHIRAALAELASDKVGDTHRVFIYYSGHGKQVPVTASGYTFQREALVPVDFLRKNGQYEWLYDYEINEALRKITKRTRRVTLILDCCHAAGSFRDGEPPGSATRSLDQIELAAVPDPGAARGAATGESATRGQDDDAAWLGRGIEACHVVSACLEHESARETTQDNLRHGLLTRAFTTALRGIPEPERSTLPWGRIWSAMRADVVRGNPYQTPRMEGNAGRLVFSGPPVDGDPGIPVGRGPAAGTYRIEAGAMAEITTGTELAIYGPEPSYFPELGSVDDLRVRLGVVRVTDARLDSADASAVNAAFDIPPDARGRVVKPGGLLRCSVRPANEEIASSVEGSQLIELVGPDVPAPVRLEQHGDRWLLIDDQHGNGDDAPILFALGSDELFCARAVLEHYHAYSLPVRMATRGAAEGLPDALELRLLSCPDEISPEQAQAAKLDAVAMDKGIYQTVVRAPVCVYVRNRSKIRLSVTPFDASASGEVQPLGDAVIDPGQGHRFWARGVLGRPFKMTLEPGVPRARDRLVVIGRTSTASTLDYLRNDKTFAKVVDECRARHGRGMDDGGEEAGRDILAGNTAATVERWTAAQSVIEISARKS